MTTPEVPEVRRTYPTLEFLEQLYEPKQQSTKSGTNTRSRIYGEAIEV
jgi:hypothetical protein